MTPDEQLDKCKKCKAGCCQHVALEIDKPTCKSDYDNIRWFLMHKDVKVFIDGDNAWTLEFATKCEHLSADNSCNNYEDRPHICSDYPLDGTLCEFDGEDADREAVFSTAKEFEKYLEKRDIDWKFKRRGLRRN